MSFYDTAAWKKLRRLRLVNEPLCRIHAAQGRAVPAKHVDHIVPINKGGEALDYDNTQSLCLECHTLKTREDEGASVKWGCDASGAPLSPRSHWN